eukprot:scaffold5641_cov42-Phaeocystis_antarctica.AAC.3
MLLRSAWRSSRSAAVVASVPSSTRSEAACGERTKVRPCSSERPSSGTASRSMKTAPSCFATRPAALLSSEASRVGVTLPVMPPAPPP